MKNLLFISLLFYSISAFGQSKTDSFWKSYIDSNIQKLKLISFDSLTHAEIIRIWNSYQVIELIKKVKIAARNFGYQDTILKLRLLARYF